MSASTKCVNRLATEQWIEAKPSQVTLGAVKMVTSQLTMSVIRLSAGWQLTVIEERHVKPQSGGRRREAIDDLSKVIL